MDRLPGEPFNDTAVLSRQEQTRVRACLWRKDCQDRRTSTSPPERAENANSPPRDSSRTSRHVQTARDSPRVGQITEAGADIRRGAPCREPSPRALVPPYKTTSGLCGHTAVSPRPSSAGSGLGCGPSVRLALCRVSARGREAAQVCPVAGAKVIHGHPTWVS